jgi:hypothetical protein
LRLRRTAHRRSRPAPCLDTPCRRRRLDKFKFFYSRCPMFGLLEYWNDGMLE